MSERPEISIPKKVLGGGLDQVKLLRLRFCSSMISSTRKLAAQKKEIIRLADSFALREEGWIQSSAE